MEGREKDGKAEQLTVNDSIQRYDNYWLLRMNMHTMFTIVTLMDYINRHCVMRTVLYIV